MLYEIPTALSVKSIRYQIFRSDAKVDASRQHGVVCGGKPATVSRDPYAVLLKTRVTSHLKLLYRISYLKWNTTQYVGHKLPDIDK